WVHGERDELDGRDVRDSGGDRLLVAPGIQWIVSERFLVEASVQLPLFQDLRGSQLELDRSVLGGFRFVY
ncbi:MAG: transporter, partial [Candidatus Binatia bacterium]